MQLWAQEGLIETEQMLSMKLHYAHVIVCYSMSLKISEPQYMVF
jgi:hypothetical protein